MIDTSWTVRPGPGRWQGEDGFPVDGYFAAVQAAVAGRGIAVDQAGRPERWNFFLLLAPEAFASSPAHAGAESVDVGWECGPDDRPLTEGFTGWGWYWTRCPGPGGMTVRSLGEHDHEQGLLAAPGAVAAAIEQLLAGRLTGGPLGAALGAGPGAQLGGGR